MAHLGRFGQESTEDVGAGAAVGHHFDGEPPPPSILDELRKLRDENRQLRHEKSAWADAQKAIERDLAAADSEAQQASRRIEDLERELRKQSGLIEASHWSQEQLESELGALRGQLEHAHDRRKARQHASPASTRNNLSGHTAAGGSESVDGDRPAPVQSPPVEELVRNTVTMLDDLAAAYGTPQVDRGIQPSPFGDDDNAARAHLLAEFESTLLEYEAELQRQRQQYQDELDEKETEIERLRLASMELRQAEAEAGEDCDSLDGGTALPLAVELSPYASPVQTPDNESEGDEDDEFFDANGPSEHAVVLASLTRDGGCTLEDLLVRLRASEPHLDWSSAKLRGVLHSMESRAELLIKIDEEGDEPRLIFYASQPVTSSPR